MSETKFGKQLLEKAAASFGAYGARFVKIAETADLSSLFLHLPIATNCSSSDASNELKKNLGPGFEDLDVTDLTPKKLARKVLGDALEDTKPVVNEIKKKSRELKDIAKIDPDLL